MEQVKYESVQAAEVVDKDSVALELPTPSAQGAIELSRDVSATKISREGSATKISREGSNISLVRKISTTELHYIPTEEEMDKEKNKDDKPFEYNHMGLTSAQAAERLKTYGPNALPEEKVPLWYIFVEQLWQVR